MPIEAHRACFRGDRFDERRNVLEAHTAAIIVKIERHIDEILAVQTNDVVAVCVEYYFLFAGLLDEIDHVDGTIDAQLVGEVLLEGQVGVVWV